MNFLRTLPKEKLQQLVLVCIFALGATGAVVQLYTLKQVRDRADYVGKIAGLQTKIKDAETAERQAVQAEPARKRLQAFITAQQERMVNGAPFAWAVRELTLVAERHPVRILNWQLGNKTPHSLKPSFTTISFHINVSGRYDDLGRFVEDLENQFPTGQIQSLTMAGAGDASGSHQAAIDLALLVRPAEPATTTK